MQHGTRLVSLAAFALSLAFAAAAGAEQHAQQGAQGAQEGAQAYEEHCASCHGPDGEAATPVGRAMNVPSFAGSQLGAAEPSAICDQVRSLDKHEAVLKKVEADSLASACERVKQLASGGS